MRLAVLAALVALADAEAAADHPLQRLERQCVDGGFLAHVLAPYNHVLLLQVEHIFLCRTAFGLLHNRQATTVETHCNGTNVYRQDNLDVVVLLLWSRSALAQLALLQQRLHPVGRRVPVLVVLGVNGTDTARGLAEEVVSILVRDRRWKIAVAIQQVNAEDSPVPVYASALSLRPGVRCYEGWTPMALELVWTPSDPRPLEALEKPSHHTNLRGCIVNMAYTSSPPFVTITPLGVYGVDFDVAHFFAHGSNASLNVLHDRNGSRSFNNAYKTQQLIETGAADIVFGGLYPSPSTRGLLAYSDPYAYNAVLCYTLRNRRLPRWQYPFRVISVKVWASLIGLLVVVVTAMQHSNRRGFVANTMTAAGVLWEGNPSPHTYTGRTALYVFLWTLFCLHFNPAYRAALAMANVHSLEEPGPTELDDVKRVIVSSADSIPLVKEYPKLNKLLHLVEFCKGPSSCAKEFRRDMKNSALIISGWTYWCYKRILLVDEDGRSLLKDQNDPLAAFHISALIARDSPIAVALNRIMAIVWHSGMIKTWGLDHRRKIQSLFKVDLNMVLRSYRPHPLGVHQILGPLSILAAGLLLSTVAFLCEVRLHERDNQPVQQDDQPDLRSLRCTTHTPADRVQNPTV